MKTTITIIITFLLTNVYGQNEDFQSLLDSAKAEFKKDKEIDQPDYVKAANYLEKAVSLKPDNVEAKYFLGYAYSRINSRENWVDGSLFLTIKSSEQFEKINKITPKYDGEIIILDPYTKITAEWGSMAMRYLNKNKLDSATWAFKEGKKRGGFGDFALSIKRKVLNSCSQDAIIISCGDNSSFPLWYLQIVEGYRKDISVIDIGLLNTTWYPAYLTKNNIVSFDLPNEVIDTIEYCEWHDSTITINNFTWTLKPSYNEQYILRADRMLLSLLKKNNFQRDIYFTIGFIEEQRLSLKNYLNSFFLIDKLAVDNKNNMIAQDYENSIIDILKLSKLINKNNQGELIWLDQLRYTIFHKVDSYLILNEKQNAKRLMKILDKYASEKKYPYQNDEGKNYKDYLWQNL